jgi:hypothetical protein
MGPPLNISSVEPEVKTRCDILFVVTFANSENSFTLTKSLGKNTYSYKGKELVEESDEVLVTLKSFDRNGGFQTRGFKPFKGFE